MTNSNLSAVILAAGKSKRMKSSTPKALHKLAGFSFLEILLMKLQNLEISEVMIVSSNELEAHEDFKKLQNKYKFDSIIQKEQNGTGGAVKVALKHKFKNPFFVLNVDAPLIKEESISASIDIFREKELDILTLGFKTTKPTGYGRLVTYGDDLVDIIEEKDATDEQRKIQNCNSGIYLINNQIALDIVNKIDNKNKQNEYYLTDIVKIGNSEGLKVSFKLIAKSEVLNANDTRQKAELETILQKHLRLKFQDKGVTLIQPETIFFSYDTEIGNESIIHPFCVFGTNVKIGDNTEILPFSHITGATIENNASVGPFARIRPNTIIGENSKIGNFVEVKASNIAKNVKASHLSYIGDASIEEGVNIGAGTIFCNYDGYSKHKSKIGKNAFIGSNSALVAPIKIGSNAIIGAGSVITEDVEENDLSIARARQVNFKQKAELIRSKKTEK